jgi:hypothetical protein
LLKIMVSPVRVRVPPLPALSGLFLFKLQICDISRDAFGSYSGLFQSFPGEVVLVSPLTNTPLVVAERGPSRSADPRRSRLESGDSKDDLSNAIPMTRAS